MSKQKKILFMCVANSARSQLAEGLAKMILGPDFEIHSAGSQPSKVNPFAIRALSEIGVDITRNTSKSVDDLSPAFIVELDYVITLCAEEVCPTIALVSNPKRLHWPLPDPAGHSGSDEEQMDRFRRIRDEIKERLEEFKKNA